MMTRKWRVAVYIVLVLGATVTSWAGLLSGLQKAWFGVAWFFCISIVTVENLAGVLLEHKIESSFGQVAAIVLRESGQISLKNRFRLCTAGIFFGVLHIAVFILSILAAFQQYWLIASLLLASALIASVIFNGLILAQRIQHCSKQLEELISHNRENGVVQAAPGTETH